MSNFKLLNQVEHQDLKVITDKSESLGDKVMLALTFPFEFKRIQECYPIFFRKDANTGKFLPIALFGFQESENLFLDHAGWQASYRPMMVERGPFIIGFQQVKTDEGVDKQRVVTIDMDSPKVNKEQGEALFLEDGSHTPYLDKVTELLEYVHEGSGQNDAFVAALSDNDLLEPLTLDITLNDGIRNQMQGFYTINEDKLALLSADQLGALHKHSFLQAIYMVIASQSNLTAMVNKKNALLANQA